MRTNLRSASLVGAAASAVALALAAPLLEGCSVVQDTEGAAVTTAGPPTLTVVDPADGACVVLRPDDGKTVRVSIATTNWQMRPAGFCGTYPQCGFVVAFVDDERVAQAAGLVIDVPFGGLATPAGEHRIRVELRDDADQPGRGADGKPLAVELTVSAVEPGGSCSGPADAGEDAPGEADASEEAAADASDDAGEDVAAEAGDGQAPEDAADEAQADAADGGSEASAEASVEAGADAAPDSSLLD